VAYAIERWRLVLTLRSKDQAQEHFLAPPRRGEARPSNAGFLDELIEVEGQVVANRDRLVALWAEYQTLRLALFRDLGALPYDDWDAFLGSLGAVPAPAPAGAKG
jgi:hypothetical protein